MERRFQIADASVFAIGALLSQMPPVDESIIKLEGKVFKKFGKLIKKKTGSEETEQEKKNSVMECDTQECR